MAQENPVALDHTPVPTAPFSCLLLLIVSAILAFLLWLGVIGQLVILVPRFEKLSAEFRMKLPLLTEMVLQYSRWAVPIFTLATLVVCIVVGKRTHWPWFFLLFLLPLILNLVVALSLYFPYMALLEGLGGGRK